MGRTLRRRWSGFRRAWAAIGLACGIACQQAPPPPPPDSPPPSPRWGTFQYTFDLKGTPAGPNSVPATIAVINAKYRLEESALKLDVYKKVARGFSASMGVDLNRIIIAKGMTSRGPFADLEEITYKDKENSTLTLYPEVFIEATPEYAGGAGKAQLVHYIVSGKRLYRWEKVFRMRISGWVAFNMEEPLTHQKMWVKRLNLDEANVTGKESYEAPPVYGPNPQNPNAPIVVRRDVGEIRYDGRVERLADYIKDNYTTIMQKCWTYLDPEECLQLKKQCEEIRVKAGFSIPK